MLAAKSNDAKFRFSPVRFISLKNFAVAFYGVEKKESRKTS